MHACMHARVSTHARTHTQVRAHVHASTGVRVQLRKCMVNSCKGLHILAHIDARSEAELNKMSYVDKRKMVVFASTHL